MRFRASLAMATFYIRVWDIGAAGPMEAGFPIWVNGTILNQGTERMKEYRIYDMLGNLIMKGSLDNSSLNRIFVGYNTAYYAVEVVTDKSVYTGKVLITK